MVIVLFLYTYNEVLLAIYFTRVLTPVFYIYRKCKESICIFHYIVLIPHINNTTVYSF